MGSIGFEEFKFLEYAREHLNGKDPVLADVGANLGDYTFVFLDMFPESECYCFEPVPDIYERLLEKLGRNNPKAHCFNYGLYNEKIKGKDFWRLLGDTDCGMSSLHYREVYFPNYPNEKIQVDLYKFDDIFKLMKPFDFVKIDTEGSELMVLEGAKNMLEIQPPSFIQWEYGGCYRDSKTFGKDVIKFFTDREYTVYNMYFTIQTVDNFEENYEVQNYFSVKI